MTAIATSNPLAVFSDLDGSPLDNGYLYYGEVDQNPIAKPIAVYWDPALTQPAVQPIRTMNGYPVRAGRAAVVYIDRPHSLTILNRSKSLVTTAFNSINFNNAAIINQRFDDFDANIAGLGGNQGGGLVAFSHTANYAVGTIGFQEKLRVHVKSFGAKGDKTADDTDAFYAAMNFLKMSPASGGIVEMEGGQYRLTRKLIVPSYVLLRGADWLPDPANFAQVHHTALYIDWGAGSAIGSNNHAIEVSHSGGVEGFTVFYPGQVLKTASTPILYDFAISSPVNALSFQDNIWIKNITLYNCYAGINLYNAGRWRVEGVQGNCFAIGFVGGNGFDVCRISKVHFWNFYTQNDNLERWVETHLVAFEFNHIDQVFADSLFGWNSSVCFSFGVNLWGSFTNILCDRSGIPLRNLGAAQVLVNNFVLISSGSSNPAIWNISGGAIAFSNGRIPDTASVGAQIDGGNYVKFTNVDFASQHASVVITGTLTTDVQVNNCSWKVPPWGPHNVRVDGERLPNINTVVPLPTPTIAPTAIDGGYTFDLSTMGNKVLAYDMTGISQRNSLHALQIIYEMVGDPRTHKFQFTVQTDVGTFQQVVFAPDFPLVINATTGTPKRLWIPFFVNHGRSVQLMSITVVPTAAQPGASLNIRGITLYEQDNRYTTDAQVSMMMRNGYNLDAYGMGVTLKANGAGRVVITRPEPTAGRTGPTPTYGKWNVGEVCQLETPVAGQVFSVMCTTPGTYGSGAPEFKPYQSIGA